MGLMEYGRGKGIIGSSVQDYIDSRFPICPMCGTRQPRWEFKGKTTMTDNRVQFRCTECESSFSITLADLTGFSKHSKPLAVLYTGPVIVNAAFKTIKGKKVTETYIRLEHIGSSIDDPVLREGEEVTVAQLQNIAASR